MRRYAREVAFCLTFEYMFNQSIKEDDECFEMFDAEKLAPEDKDFVLQLYRGVSVHIDEYKNKVATYSKGFKLDRIYKIDLAILALTMYELEHFDTPIAVCINEAVDLAKKYSTDKSLSYVNGILAEFVRANPRPTNA
ncbi:MAG: transcription antitermination factor NusB [Clostridia bacterium]